MSQLRIFDVADGVAPLASFDTHADIARELGNVGIRFEHWRADQPVAPGAAQDTVIAAYRTDIDRLMREGGYRSVDVISMAPDHPDRATLRRKFLDEHTHGEDEVRFFVAGSGQFSLHIGDKVYDVVCTAGDLIGVPAGTRHWFDMSAAPSFVAIRLFTNPDGWVAQFTGDAIAERFPRMQAAVSA